MSTEFEKQKKIRPGKLALSLVVYIIGVPIATVIIGIILSFIAQIPIISAFVNYFFKVQDPLGDWKILLIPMLLSNYLAFKASEHINGFNYKTHGLATLIYGIVFIVFQVVYLICNIILGNWFVINIAGIIVGVCLIGLGKEEL